MIVPVELSKRIDAIFDEEISRASAIDDPGTRSLMCYTLHIIHSRIIGAEADTIFQDMCLNDALPHHRKGGADGKDRGRQGIQGLQGRQVARGGVLLDRGGHPPCQHADHTQVRPRGGRHHRHRTVQDHRPGGRGEMKAYLCSACEHRACESYTEDGSIPALCPDGGRYRWVRRSERTG